MGLAGHGILQLRIGPRLAVIGGNFNPANRSAARPCRPANFVVSRARHLLSTRWPRDHGFRPQFELEPARLAVKPQTGILRAFPHIQYGWSTSLIRRNHFTLLMPSQPATIRRNG